jgi:hypothetical protein
LLKLYLFIKISLNKNIKAKTFILLIISKSIYIIKRILNKKFKSAIINLILKDIIIIKGFYINIILKAYLLKLGI